MRPFWSIAAVLAVSVFAAPAAFAQQQRSESDSLQQLRKEVADLRSTLDSLKAAQDQQSFLADDELESLEERLEKRFRDLENKINSATRSTAPIVFNPRTTAFINFAARADNKKVLDETGVNEISNRFFLRGVELDLRAPVDPYAEAVAILSVENEAGKGFGIGAEEAYGLIKRLPLLDSAPLGMKLKIGRFRAPFGVNNRTHLHDMPWVTRPIAVSKYLGTEYGNFFEGGFNPVGVDLDFFLPSPLPGSTLEMNADVLTAGDLGLSGGSAGRQPAFLGHLNLSTDWNNEHILTVGASAYTERGLPSTQLYGVDLTYKWSPVEQRESHSVVFGAEAFFGRHSFRDSTSTTLTIKPYGWYAFLQYQLSYWLYLGTRYDWAQEPIVGVPTQQSTGFYATYYTTEFLRFRLGIEHRTGTRSPLDGLNTGLLEVNLVFGSHPAEPYWVNR